MSLPCPYDGQDVDVAREGKKSTDNSTKICEQSNKKPFVNMAVKAHTDQRIDIVKMEMH